MLTSGVVERDGCKLHYWTAGSGPPVLLIQGVGVIGEGWRPQIDALSKHFTCCWFDNRGIGQSMPMGRVTVDQMVDDALAVMTAVGWRTAHVVGHSLGGLIAHRLAGRVGAKSLSLLCTFASGRECAPLSLRMLWLGARTRLGTRAMRRRAFLGLIMSPRGPWPVDPDTLAKQLEPLFGHDLGDQPPVVSHQLKAMRTDSRADMACLAGVPTLVVSATEDPIAPPRVGRTLADAIPGAKFVEIPSASHGVVIQHADRINQLLLEHLL